MKKRFTQITMALAMMLCAGNILALSPGDISVRQLSGYFWMDDACTPAGPKGKVLSFRIVNTKGSTLNDVVFSLGSIGFTATGLISYTSGTPSYLCRTTPDYFIDSIAAGDSATAFFFIGYNCLLYPGSGGGKISTDFITFPLTVSDDLSGSVSLSRTQRNYILRNASNNTINITSTTTNVVGSTVTISVAYAISNVKPTNIIDMELSTMNTFPSGYDIVGCRITASSMPLDFPPGQLNTHYRNSTVSNLPSGGTATIEWTLRITNTITGLNSGNIIPYVVSDAGSSQRWQAATATWVGTSTPVNPIVISKRVSNAHVLINDTVEYTIVITNTSPVSAVKIDKLVDFLPRDYQFRYLETNTFIYPSLVTYANSISYPEYLDTSYLVFNGNKHLGGGNFSWTIPSNDSIKLIYSVVVSADPGLNDTNFVSAYIGTFNAGTATAVVNVYAFLPLDVLFFTARKGASDVELQWGVQNPPPGTRFELSRYNVSVGEYELLQSFETTASADRIFSFSDESAFQTSVALQNYRLLCYLPSGETREYHAEIDLSGEASSFTAFSGNGSIQIQSRESHIRQIEVDLTDALGRVLHSETLLSSNGIFELPYQNETYQGQSCLLRIRTRQQAYVQKLILQ